MKKLFVLSCALVVMADPSGIRRANAALMGGMLKTGDGMMAKTVDEDLYDRLMRLPPKVRGRLSMEHSDVELAWACDDNRRPGLPGPHHGPPGPHHGPPGPHHDPPGPHHGPPGPHHGPPGPHDPPGLPAPHGPHGPHDGPHALHRPHEPHEHPEVLRNMAGRGAMFARERVLGVLIDHEAGLRQKHIAEEIGVNPSSMSEFIDRLENDGYVERTVDPSDRRATLIVLTEKGKARAYELEDSRHERLNAMFGCLTEVEKKELIRLLDKVRVGRDDH